MDKNQIRDKIAGKRLKVTHQRMVILSMLYEMNIHPTAEEVHKSLVQDIPSLSLGTVYKTLDTFIACGLANKVMLDDGKMRYDINTDEHHHIILDQKEVIDYTDNEIKAIIQQHLAKKNIQNLQVNDIHLQIFGSRIDPHKPVELEKK